MLKRILLFILLFNTFLFTQIGSASAARDCTVLGPSDLNTFKEYCYKITESFFSLRNKYEVDGEIDSYFSDRILNYARQGLNYLPDDLINTNYYSHLKTAVERGKKNPRNSTNFDSIATAIDNFLNKTNIKEISGEIDVFPATGNAPLTVTLRGDVNDPTGTKLENYNYTWWILDRGIRKNIGNNKFLNYTFREEGNYSIFLDVTSNHRNSLRNVDVIPFSKKASISVKEKVASLILKVDTKNLEANDELKFSPDDSVYGLLFDATASTPTSGTKFIQTEWNFGNGVTRRYNSAPKIERVVYANEGNYPVTLRMKTNTGKVVERKFTIIIRNPIATINSSSTEGFLGDKFTFTANSFGKSDLRYLWEVVDLKNDKIIFSKDLSTLTYSFPNKGRYNVRLAVTGPSGEKDYDNKIIYINSRPPVAVFTHSIPNKSKPNTIFLDASQSYDLDFSDDGKLEYSWIINGDRVNLENPNFNGSNGYFTFENIGEQSVSLEVKDPDDLVAQKNMKINIASNLSVDLISLPRVSQIGKNVRFVADSPKARFFEWDFGDGVTTGGGDSSISHKYSKSGIYTVRLTVRNENDNKNSIEKVVYIGDSEEPFANINILGNSSSGNYEFKTGVCGGKGAYLVNKVENVTLSGSQSIDITGDNNGLDYTWKVGDKFYTGSDISRRFDDIGCIPVKLTVKSKKNGKESVAETYLKVENVKPTLSGLEVSVKDISSDPVIVDVKALGAVDKDGVIQSYLWYYYTDVSSEPQDFRATKTPNTTFVLPKITGTYYFVSVLKDNNEDRTSSDDLGSKYYITLTGDNINTPIVGVSANNTSIKAGEEVVFTVKTTDILGRNLDKEVKYSWDFDGDGFYDLETDKNVISHKFTKSGEKRVKVKVKNKGFSNTKSITVNVSNVLKPDFDYISIGNDFIFFNKTLGSVDRFVWEMGDGKTVEKRDSFVYNYDDGKSSRIVKLKAFDGTNTKEISKKVVRDFGKMISLRKQPLSIFSNYEVSENKIVLNEEVFDLEIFVRSNLSNVKYFAVDFNIENDSDLNGGVDDDVDNKNTSSYTSGGPIKVELNSSKNQKIKIFLKDENKNILEVKELTIEKKYIKEEKNISTESIKLDGVPDIIKKYFEKIKEEVSKFDKDDKLKSLTYIQKIQEEWGDKLQRTHLIMEFISFVEGLNYSNSRDVRDLLEGISVEGKEITDEYEKLLINLKNLIPQDISCPEEFQKDANSKGFNCYNLLTGKLQTIFDNYDLEENKVLGKEILKVIEKNDKMTNIQKNDFKGLLSKMVHKAEKPDEKELPKERESNQSVDENSISDSGVLGNIFKIIFWILLVVGGIFLIGFVVYFISYKIKGNKGEQSFSDYVAEQTDNLEKENSFDFKDDFDPLSEKSLNDAKESSVPDWLTSAEKTSNSDEKNFENISNEDKVEQKQDGEIPSWLTGGDVKNETEIKNEFVEEEKEESKEEKVEEIPDWLKTEEQEKTEIFVEEEKKEPKEEKMEEIPDWLKTEEQEKTEIFVEEEKEEIKEEKVEEIPDWLKTEEQEKTENFVEEEKEEVKEEKVEEIPDWLKTEEQEKTEIFVEEEKEELKEEKVEEIPDWLKTEELEIVNENKKDFKKDLEKEKIPKLETREELDEFTKIEIDEEPEQIEALPDWLTESNQTISEEPKKSTNKKSTTKNKKTPKKTDKIEENNSSKKSDDELWDDGMKIPDWLKVDTDDKKQV